MKRSSLPLLTLGFTCVLWTACGDEDVGGSIADLTAGPSRDGAPETGTCGQLEEDCSDRCSGSFENVECTGPLSGSYDNVTVPPGATCTLDEAFLTGNLIVEESATATVGPNVFVCGDFQGDEASRVDARRTRVCGNVQFDEGGTAEYASVEVLKNLQVSKSDEVDLRATLVCADAQLVENASVDIPTGAAVVVGKNCSADENTRATFDGLDVRGDDDGCRTR